MRRKRLKCISAFVREVDAAARPTCSRRAHEARLVHTFLQLPEDMQTLVAAGYRQLLMASDDTERARASRAIVAHLARGTGLDHESVQALAAEPGPAQAVAGPVRRRPDSQPGSHLVATAVPSPGRARRSRTPRRRPYALAALASLACVGLLLAWSWLHTPTQRLTAPEPTARATFPIFQMIETDDGLLLFSHGEIDGDTTWLNAFEVHLGDTPRPAADVSVEVEARASEGDGDKTDIKTAERVRKVSGSNQRIPPRSARRRAIPVKMQRGDDAVLIKVWGKTDRRSDEKAMSLHRIRLNR